MKQKVFAVLTKSAAFLICSAIYIAFPYDNLKYIRSPEYLS